jgi:hypothetical protein
MRHPWKDHRFLFVCSALGLALLLAVFGPIGCGSGRAPVEIRPEEGEETKSKDANLRHNKPATTTDMCLPAKDRDVAPPRDKDKPISADAPRDAKDGYSRDRDTRPPGDKPATDRDSFPGDAKDRAPVRDPAPEKPAPPRRVASPPQQDAILGQDGSARKTKPDPTPEPKPSSTPQVWKRDRQRPSFARVYVGDGNALELVSLHVTVVIDGPRARTFVDHIFRNPNDRQLEGTFEYPLPTGASPSYFAMYLGQSRDAMPSRFGRRGDAPALPPDDLARLKPEVVARRTDTQDWGTLQEARVVNKVRAVEVYEQIVRGKIDPALLEYAGGNTFSGRVFPIAPRGYNRVLLAYEELMPWTADGVHYRFPLPDCKLVDLQFTLEASGDECKAPALKPAFDVTRNADRLLHYQHTWRDKGPGGEVVFRFTPAHNEVQAIAGRQGESGPLYLYARIHPKMQLERAQSFADQAIFLLDTSLSEHPDRFAVNMKLLRKILESDPDIKRFNVMTFDVAARLLEPDGWLDNTEKGREQAFAKLDGLLLEGATNLSAALDLLARTCERDRKPVNVFLLSDGQITWGETSVSQLTARFESRCSGLARFHCYRTGLGADNLELFEALTRRGGGVFNCFSEDELAATAVAHRHECFQVEKVSVHRGPGVSDLLVAGRKAAVYPGGDLIVAAKLDKLAPLTLVVEGLQQGKKTAFEYVITPDSTSELAARGWGEIVVASLLAVNDPKLDPLVTAYCQQFNIASRAASFLVLENEADYKRLNLEAERGRLIIAGDLSTYLDALWADLGKLLPERAVFVRLLSQIEARIRLTGGENDAHLRKLLASLTDADFELPEEHRPGTLLQSNQVPVAYLKARKADPRNVVAYVTEARRRADKDDADGAVRALSSVIEQYPGRADALRLVGYRLLDLKQPAQAARLFRQVEQTRPFEAHSYRDLARSLEECGKYGLAAVHYEIVLGGTWDNRFAHALKMVVAEEYAQMMQTALRNKKGLNPALIDQFGERLEKLTRTQQPSDLRVTISWNTDATDVDLWVVEPDGDKCYYQHNRTKNGGELSQDQTQGYGPERYQIARAIPGTYTVFVHYFAANQNLLAGETHVQVTVTRNAGRPNETSERFSVILKKQNEQVEVTQVKY